MEEKVTIEALLEILEAAKVDYEKLFVKNNKAAATRLRKAYQEVIAKCKAGRAEATEYKNGISK